ncbi:MAG TPA: type IV pilus secretin PilQ [Candidatus Acidoferrum sp.]|nr:type IV pilus secretin PilQ [Candidatus Acidoferrum sp.]
MNNNTSWKFGNVALHALIACVLACCAGSAFAQTSLDNVSFAGLPGNQFQIDLQFSDTPPKPDVFVIDKPARLTLDFPNTRNNLKERRYPLNFSNADSVTVLEAQGRTRLVVNLSSAVPYATSVKGNTLSVVVGRSGGAGANAAQVTSNDAPAGARFVSPVASGKDIEKLDFRRGDNNAGMIVIDLGRSNLNVKVNQTGSKLQLELPNASIKPNEQVKLDVTDFGTPVQDVSMFLKDGKVQILANVTGQYEYLAYQTDKQYVLSVTPTASAGGAVAAEKNFKGDKIDLNFQSIDIRAALQILAEFNDFSLVVGPSVNGNVTLRLENVPWDQAVDLVLRSNKLGKRIDGNVMYVAPADEIANAEVRELESTQKVQTLAPLVTEYIPINYAQAAELVKLLPSGKDSGILTERGRASVDIRTNTLIVQDVEAVLTKVKALIAKLDVPVRQVLIEARIVNATTSFSQAMGIRWGGAQLFPKAGDQFILSGNLNSTTQVATNLSQYAQTVNQAVAGGTPLATALSTTTLQGPSFPDALMVDMGVASAPSHIALGYAGSSGLLQLELSALEDSGNGEVIAQPKITTQDQQSADISSGVQIPYQSQAGGTAGGTTTQFITAALSLKVTPQITPDGNIIMKLEIHQDSVVAGSGSVPSIATNVVNTRVLVNNGDTIVLGGVYREEVTTSVSKTPLLGDIPYVGSLFKKKEDSKTKTELLVFITPSVITEVK